ncbi:MAG: hypothetical protein J5715_10380 [Clostridiales bacterium]|nr:hypothetical protein [Clostridiales bacterium]
MKNRAKITACVLAGTMFITAASACNIVTGIPEEQAPETTAAPVTESTESESSAEDTTEATSEDITEFTTSESTETSETSDPTVSVTERSDESEETSASSAGYNDIYTGLLVQAYEIIKKGPGEAEIPDGMMGIAEIAAYSPDTDLLKNIGFKIEDITGDNVPELMIGTGVNVLAVYTVKDGEAVVATEGWDRSSVAMLNDGSFYTSGSGGAANYIFGRYTLSEDGSEKVWSDCYFTDLKDEETWEIGLYHNKTGDLDVNTSEELTISRDDFDAIDKGLQSRIVELNLQPISYGVPSN